MSTKWYLRGPDRAGQHRYLRATDRRRLCFAADERPEQRLRPGLVAQRPLDRLPPSGVQDSLNEGWCNSTAYSAGPGDWHPYRWGPRRIQITIQTIQITIDTGANAAR
jgi:hypothetical protein